MNDGYEKVEDGYGIDDDGYEIEDNGGHHGVMRVGHTMKEGRARQCFTHTTTSSYYSQAKLATLILDNCFNVMTKDDVDMICNDLPRI